MADTYNGILAQDTLSAYPNFSTVRGNLIPTVVPISAGAVTSVDPRFGNARWGNRWDYRLMSSEDKFAFFSFWASHSGGVDGFWLPSWISDFTLTEDVSAGQNLLQIESTTFKSIFDSLSDMSNPFTDPANPLKNYWGIMLWERGGDRHFRGIKEVSDNAVLLWGTNVLPNGSDMGAATWTAGGPTPLTITVNTDIAPDGTMTADKLTALAGTSGSYVISDHVTINSGEVVSTNFFVKKGVSGELVSLISKQYASGFVLKELLEVELDTSSGVAVIRTQTRPSGAPPYDSSSFTVEDYSNSYWRVSVRSSDFSITAQTHVVMMYPYASSMPSAVDQSAVVVGVESFSGGGFPNALTTEDIDMVSLVRFVRFSSGELKMSFLTDNKLVDISTSFSELFFEGAFS